MSTTYKPLYTAGSAAYTVSPENVATSSTFVAGVESNSVSNLSNLYLDILTSGLWTSGTTPTTNTYVQAWLVLPLSDDFSSTVTWPDVFDGTASAETVTSAGILSGLGYPIGTLLVDSNTSNRAYYQKPASLASMVGGIAPWRHVIFIVHNTGVNSNSTAGNHAWYYVGVQTQGV